MKKICNQYSIKSKCSRGRIIAVAAALGCVHAVAMGQLHENIEVEGKYVPEIIRIDKIHTFPATERVQMDSSPLPYDEEGVVASIPPYLVSLEATRWRAVRDIRVGRGYVDFSLGSWLSSDLSAGYRFLDTEKTKAGVSLQFNSASLWKPRMSQASDNVRRELYDGALDIYASHHFEEYGYLDVSADWECGYFNYYGYVPQAGGYIMSPGEESGIKAPTQTYNEVAARIGWRSESFDSESFWTAAAGVRHSAWRALYLPMASKARRGDRETMIYLEGSVAKPWDSGSSVGIDAEGDLLVYAGAGEDIAVGGAGLQSVDGVILHRPDNYGQISLTPYYGFKRGRLNVRIGAEVDLTFNAGLPGDRFGVFHIAPDVRIDWRKGVGALFLHAGGGNELNTLSSARRLDYYTMPALVSTRPVYSPLDAVAGFGLGPFSGFSMEAAVAYKISRGVYTGGWYQSMLNFGLKNIDGITGDGSGYLYSLDPSGMNINGFSFRARLSYSPLSMLTVKAEGTYQPQKGKTGYFNGYDRPEFTACISADVRITEKIRVYAGYDYRGKRRIFTQWRSYEGAPSDGGLKADVKEILHPESLRLPDLSLLNAGASWQIHPDVTLRVDAFNLLNRHDQLLPSLPDQGITVTGGVSVTF